ncbi:hypothetical protein Tsubulata_008963 [Turnera subulata]|uniref:DUF547 domain-containing protein n=1 Tax=Turnera subulata TaxID=218843 RepID=A0A9Q0FT24_9ROSI|nr:hypothetical protein Tsubulata_008963 [Turnera subulata]
MEDYIMAKKMQTSKTEVQNALKEEILELQGQLQDQFVIRHALEKALTSGPFSIDLMADKSIPMPAEKLIKEIAVLELEVAYLERYLLCLYRKTFDQQVPPSSAKDEVLEKNSVVNKANFPLVSAHDIMSETNSSVTHTSVQNSKGNPHKEVHGSNSGLGKWLDSGIYRCHSSMSQRSGGSPPLKSIARALDSYHSLPLSMLEDDALNASSLADHLGSRVRNGVFESPNWISEEMVKLISAIYCELADPPLINPDSTSSPISASSSPTEFPSQSDMWSPQCRISSFNSSLDNPFHIGESKEFSGPYCTMAKVECICRENHKLKDMQNRLHDFRSLVTRLEVVNPRKMNHEEKLAFWINVHNALVMHAYLVYGIPQNSGKRISLALKAAYNIGGQTVNVEMIQSSILGCRLPRPGQWLRLLFSSKTKFKAGDARKAYSIDHIEPRLYFALCTGSYSDPAVRVYSPESVFGDLEAAKEEYIQSTLTIHRDKKLLLPKIVESFSKDSDICLGGLVEMMEHLLPSPLRKRIHQDRHYKKFGKSIEWIPHNFTFRYLLSKQLAP